MNKKESRKLARRVLAHNREHQSSAREIYKKFLKPIIEGVKKSIETKNEDRFTDKDILDIILTGREIHRYTAKRTFNIPGGIVKSCRHKEFLPSGYLIKKNEMAWIRTDIHQSYVDIEVNCGPWLRVSSRQWKEIEHNFSKVILQ